MDIKVDHISKAYGEQQVLQDLSCVFPEGKTTCIRRSRISVVLPHPDLPLIQVVFPSGKTQDKSCSTCCSPYALLI